MKRRDIGGGYDLWERQGAQHVTPEERARIEADAAETLRQGAIAKDALIALIAADTDATQAWARTHEAYLQAVLEKFAAEGKADSIEARIAREALEEWGTVRAGRKPYADAYQTVEPTLYRRYFGIDPDTLEDV